MHKDNIYITQNLALASAIQLTSTAELNKVEKDPDGKASFIFNRTDDLSQTLDLFWQKKLKVDAFSYFESLRYMKSRIYEVK